MATLTVAILTMNEEHNLHRCFRSVKWANRIIVVDSGSTDRTVEIANKEGCDVFQNKWPGFAGQRNWALQNTNITTEWVLFIDADEVITEKLKVKILKATEDTKYNAYYLCPKVILWGKWVKRSSCYPVWHPRMARVGKVEYKDSASGHAETWDVEGEKGYIKEPYLHFIMSKGLGSWFNKHNSLATAECEAYFSLGKQRNLLRRVLSHDKQERRQALRALSYRLPFRSLLKFFYLFILRRGFLDGPSGWSYCRLYMIYEEMICEKIYERKYINKETTN